MATLRLLSRKQHLKSALLPQQYRPTHLKPTLVIPWNETEKWAVSRSASSDTPDPIACLPRRVKPRCSQVGQFSALVDTIFVASRPKIDIPAYLPSKVPDPVSTPISFRIDERGGIVVKGAVMGRWGRADFDFFRSSFEGSGWALCRMLEPGLADGEVTKASDTADGRTDGVGTEGSETAKLPDAAGKLPVK